MSGAQGIPWGQGSLRAALVGLVVLRFSSLAPPFHITSSAERQCLTQRVRAFCYPRRPFHPLVESLFHLRIAFCSYLAPLSIALTKYCMIISGICRLSLNLRYCGLAALSFSAYVFRRNSIFSLAEPVDGTSIGACPKSLSISFTVLYSLLTFICCLSPQLPAPR